MEKISLIVDSGAYSAWRTGKPIDIDKYCDYLLANKDWITHYVALDVIDPRGPEMAAAASHENLVHMRGRGLSPIPVYHVGEDISWLYKMLDMGCDYIGLSASSLVSRNKVDDWYAFAWSHLVTRDGRPIVKAHAFGEGRYESLRRFPWTSADTTSWIYSSQVSGVATLPTGAKVGMRHDGKSSSGVPDLNEILERDRVELDDLFRQHHINPEVFDKRDVEAAAIRAYLAAVFYIEQQKRLRALQPIRFKPSGFLSQFSTAKPINDIPFNMYLVLGAPNVAIPLFAKTKHPNLLASYFYILDTALTKEEQHAWMRITYLKEFVRDRDATARSTKRYQQYWETFDKYITI